MHEFGTDSKADSYAVDSLEGPTSVRFGSVTRNDHTDFKSRVCIIASATRKLDIGSLQFLYSAATV